MLKIFFVYAWACSGVLWHKSTGLRVLGGFISRMCILFGLTSMFRWGIANSVLKICWLRSLATLSNGWELVGGRMLINDGFFRIVGRLSENATCEILHRLLFSDACSCWVDQVGGKVSLGFCYFCYGSLALAAEGNFNENFAPKISAAEAATNRRFGVLGKVLSSTDTMVWIR